MESPANMVQHLNNLYRIVEETSSTLKESQGADQ